MIKLKMFQFGFLTNILKKNQTKNEKQIKNKMLYSICLIGFSKGIIQH